MYYWMDDLLKQIRQLVDLGDAITALEAIDAFLSLYPNHLSALVERITISVDLGDFFRIREDAEIISELLPGSAKDIFANAATLYSDNPTASIRLLDLAIHLNSSFERAWYVRGAVHYREHNYGSAARDMAKALSLSPLHGNALLYAGLANEKRRAWQSAIRYLMDYINSPMFTGEPIVYRTLARCCVMMASEIDRKKRTRARR